MIRDGTYDNQAKHRRELWCDGKLTLWETVESIESRAKYVTSKYKKFGSFPDLPKGGAKWEKA